MSVTVKTFIEKYVLTDPDFKYYYTYLQGHPVNIMTSGSGVVSVTGNSFLTCLRRCDYVDNIYYLYRDSLDQPEKASEAVKLITSRMYLIIVLDMFFNKVKEVTVDQDRWKLSVEEFDLNALFNIDDWFCTVTAKNKAHTSLRLYIYFTSNTFYVPQYITMASSMSRATKKYSFKLDSPIIFIEHIKWLIGDNK